MVAIDTTHGTVEAKNQSDHLYKAGVVWRGGGHKGPHKGDDT